MMSHDNDEKYLTATTAEGILILHSSPITLSWLPHDVINNAYNIGGIVTVGTFDSIDDAKRAANEQYSVGPGEWRGGDFAAFEIDEIRTEIHTPEVDGHKVIRHGIRWK